MTITDATGITWLLGRIPQALWKGVGAARVLMPKLRGAGKQGVDAESRLRGFRGANVVWALGADFCASIRVHSTSRNADERCYAEPRSKTEGPIRCLHDKLLVF
jgi:hypothetical protein